jgi:7,8-dihydropterin-6-yl-methyl-4-(beta-D-ribofuranosyl)aminobenzene 5'-phosphate synthase
MDTVDIPVVDKVEITTLCENLVDLGLPSKGPVLRLRPSNKDAGSSPLMVEALPEPFAAAHGLSALVRLTKGGITRSVLFDAGGSADGLIHNLDCLELSPKDWNCIVLSHGHWDHVLGLTGVFKRTGRLAFPLTLHPDAYLYRGTELAIGEIRATGAPSRQGLRDAGLELLETDRPTYVVEKMALVTGQVPRTNDFETGTPRHLKKVEGEWQPDPLICDDQALVVNLRGKGLVVLSGCGHAGIINTVTYAQALSGVERVHAVIGGFHLGGDDFQDRIPAVVDAFTALQPALLAPAHCTGYRAAMAIYQALPDAYVQNTVGTRITLEADD